MPPRSLLLSLGVLALHTALAQGADSSAAGFIPRLNVVKIGATSGLAKTLSLSYERVLNPDVSVALTLSYMLPIRPEGLLNLNTDELVIGGDRELKSIFITPEVKWYVEHSDVRPAPRGFYVGAYLRYSNMRYTSSVTAEATTSEGTLQGDLQIDLTELGAGIDAGYQLLMLNDRLAVDFIFFGPRYCLYNLKVDAQLGGNGELYDDLEQALEDFLGRDIAPVDLQIEKSGTTTMHRNGLGYRAGFKIGYAF